MGTSRRNKMTRMPHYPSKAFRIFCGLLFVIAGYGLWALLYYMAITH